MASPNVLHGSASRTRPTGAASPAWKGGRVVRKIGGYVMVFLPEKR